MKKINPIVLLPFILLSGCSDKTNAYEFSSGGKLVDVFDKNAGLKFAKDISSGFNKSFDSFNDVIGVSIKIDDSNFSYFKGRDDDRGKNGIIASAKKVSGVFDIAGSNLFGQLKDANIALKSKDLNCKVKITDHYTDKSDQTILTNVIKNNKFAFYSTKSKFYADFTGDKILSSVAPIVREFLPVDQALIDKIMDALESPWDLTDTIKLLKEDIFSTQLLDYKYKYLLDDVGESLLGITEMQLAENVFTINEYNDGHYEINAKFDHNLLNALLESEHTIITEYAADTVKEVDKFGFYDDTNASIMIKTNSDLSLKSISICGLVHWYSTEATTTITLYTGSIFTDVILEEISIDGNISIDFNYNLKEVEMPDFKPFNIFPITLFL